MSAREVTRTAYPKITLDYRGFQPDFTTLVYQFAHAEEAWLLTMENLPSQTTRTSITRGVRVFRDANGQRIVESAE